MIKNILIASAVTILLTGCDSQSSLVNTTCDCVKEAKEAGSRLKFRECMGDDYEKLGEIDHSENEKEFVMKVRETCPDVASDFRL